MTRLEELSSATVSPTAFSVRHRTPPSGSARTRPVSNVNVARHSGKEEGRWTTARWSDAEEAEREGAVGRVQHRLERRRRVRRGEAVYQHRRDLVSLSSVDERHAAERDDEDGDRRISLASPHC
jgi:hypothetical protein